MNPNPFKALLYSRKFWLIVLDAIISTVTIIVGRYAQAEAEFIRQLITIYQPVFVAIIIGIAAEDAAIKANGRVNPPVQ